MPTSRPAQPAAAKTMQKKTHLLVCGASARQVVSIATAAGFGCIAIDLFADWDTQKLCRCEKVDRLDQVSEVAQDLVYDRLILTGGMENHINLIRQHCADLPCRDLDSFVACRNPLELNRIVTNSRLLKNRAVNFPETTCSPTEKFDAEPWLVKQSDRAGGLGVRRANKVDGRLRGKNRFLQREIRGNHTSGLFIGDGCRASLLATSSQWSGKSKLGCREFSYCGSIAPHVLSSVQHEAVIMSGKVIAAEFGLRGIFGIDFILAGETTWVIEVNPRITASAEVCQPLLKENIVQQHVRALCDTHFAVTAREPAQIEIGSQRYYGKAVIYNRLAKQLEITPILHRRLCKWHVLQNSPAGVASQICDIPMPDTIIAAAAPAVTIKTSSQKKSAVEQKLLRLAEEVYQLLEQ